MFHRRARPRDSVLTSASVGGDSSSTRQGATIDARVGRRGRRAGWGLALLGLAGFSLVLAGCSKGELDVSCSEFLNKSSSEQEQLGAAWTQGPGRSPYEPGDPLFDVRAREDLQLIREYCPDHPDDSLAELEWRP